MLTSPQLISGLFAFFTERYLGGSEQLRVFIAPGTDPRLSRSLERVLLGLDARLDLDLQRSTDSATATVVIQQTSSRGSTDPITGRPTTVIGSAEPGDSGWLVKWAHSSSGNLATIVHELGHTLGLAHPNESDPFDSRYSTADTVMSYNRAPGQSANWYTSLDLEALTTIWGIENDPASARHTHTSGNGFAPGVSLMADLDAALQLTDPAAFVDLAYWLLLGRPADAGGLAHWQQQLSTGLDRGAVVDQLLLSAEYSQLLA